MTVTVAVEGGGPTSGAGETADLMARYTAYVERKAASTRATRNSYSRLLDRIAAGDVDPKVLDQSLNWFWHAYGPEHAHAVSELMMQFLSEVVQLSYEQSRELIEEVAPDALEASTDWTTSFEQLVDYADRERAAQREALRAAIAPDTTPQPAVGVASNIVERLTTLCFELFSRLDSINAEIGLRYLDTVVPDDGPDAIELHGAVGGSVRCRFIVSNDTHDMAAVHCAVADMRREDGIGPAFEPAVAFTPDSLRLPPDGSAQVSCSIALTDSFATGVTYLGELRVDTGDDAVLRIPVRVRTTEPNATT